MLLAYAVAASQGRLSIREPPIEGSDGLVVPHEPAEDRAAQAPKRRIPRILRDSLVNSHEGLVEFTGAGQHAAFSLPFVGCPATAWAIALGAAYLREQLAHR